MNLWRTYLLYILCITQTINLVKNEENPSWGDWSPCTKSCDIGTRKRSRGNNTEPDIETQYCNTQYCVDIKQTCNGSSVTECYPSTGSYGKCVNGACQCTLGNGYNKYNCYPEYGNCVIRIEPPTALGFRDPEVQIWSKYKLHSCTTDDNKVNEVHIIGIYGDRIYRTYQVSILPRGPVNKPIILVLTSYEQIIWKINSTVDLKEVIYGGYKSDASTVEYVSTYNCTVPVPKRRPDLENGFGSDTGGGHTLQVLQTIALEYGPITSFTGYYEVNVFPMANIILKVGGDPLSVISREYIYNLSMVECNPSELKCQYPNATSDQTWGKWSPCSKTCDIGTRIREICSSNGDLIKKEEEYCNMQFCPVILEECSNRFDCHPSLECISKKCQCNLGDHYNKLNCNPEFGNCFIRKDPPTALGYKDPDLYYPSFTELYSCTSNDNSRNEVHVIGIYGDRYKHEYQISILPRGPITKPIILVLVAYKPTFWKINTPVDLKEVIYGGDRVDASTVEQISSPACKFNAKKRWTLGRYGYGYDKYDGNTINIIKDISAEYGPITSFTGYYRLSSTPDIRIILKVGGNPLSVIPADFMFNLSMVNCTSEVEFDPFCRNPNLDHDKSWGQWTPCSKSCDVGTRTRERCNTTEHLLEKEEEYCNLQYCPDIWFSCSETSSSCYQPHIWDYRGKCVDGKCECELGKYFNKYNCYPEYGSCIMRNYPPFALTYKDPTRYYPYKTSHLSCTTNDNAEREIHIIGIKSLTDYDTLQITIEPRGPITKPIILVLAGFLTTRWKINTTVDIEEVVYRGQREMNSSTVEQSGTKHCHIRTTRRFDLPFSYAANKNTIDMLQLITAEYGPITSFSGYSHILSYPVPNIILKVGGNHLAVIPENFVCNISADVCSSMKKWENMCITSNADKTKVQQTEYSWGDWTHCSKACNEGTRIREKCNSTGHLVEREEHYCNIEPCNIDTQITCSKSWSTCQFIQGQYDSGRCINGTCYCVLGEEYVSNHCYPRMGNCWIKPNPLSALGYKDPSVPYRDRMTLYSCTTNDNPIYEVHIIGIYGIKYKNNTYKLSVVPRSSVTKPIVLILTSFATTHWKIHSKVGLYKVVYGGKNKLSSSVNIESGCNFKVEKYPINEFGFGKDTRQQETLTLLKSITAKYGPITSFTGYENLRSDSTPGIILNVGGDPLQVLQTDTLNGMKYVNCSSLEPPLHPVFPTTTPIIRSGTIKISPSEEIVIMKDGYLNLECHYISRGTMSGKESVFLFDNGFHLVSNDPTVRSSVSVDNNGINLIATKRANLADSGTYTCMEMKSGISASVKVLVVDEGPVVSWGEWTTCSKSCDIGVRSRVGLNKRYNAAQRKDQYCNLNYCPSSARKCYRMYCDPDIGDLFCTLGSQRRDDCYPYNENCIIRKNPKVAIGYRDPSKTVVSNLYSCTTNDNYHNEVHIIGIYGDSVTKDYTVNVNLRGPVTKPIILVLTSHHNTHWKINTSVDLYKVLYYDDDAYPTTVEKLPHSQCGFHAISRNDLYFGYGFDRNGGYTVKTMIKIATEFGPITSFTGYLHLRPLQSSSSHIILNVGGDPLSVKLDNYASVSCLSKHQLNHTNPVSDDTGNGYIIIILLCVGVGLVVVAVIICILYRCLKEDRQFHRYQPSVPVEVSGQENETNIQQGYALSHNSPPPAYSEEAPPSYDTVMRDYQKEETYM